MFELPFVGSDAVATSQALTEFHWKLLRDEMRRHPAAGVSRRRARPLNRTGVLDETHRAKFESWYPGLFHVRNADRTEHALAA